MSIIYNKDVVDPSQADNIAVTGETIGSSRVQHVTLKGSSTVQANFATTGSSLTVTAVEVEIPPIPNQLAVTAYNLSAGKLHHSLSTGVNSSFTSIEVTGIISLEDSSASLFVIRGTGTSRVQVDRLLGSFQ